MSSSQDLSGVCRVCLAGRLKLYGVKNKQLQALYENLSKTEFDVVTGANVTMCYICYYQLKKIWKFSKLAQKTNKILYNLVDRGVEITNESIEYNALCTQLSLSIAMIPSIVIESGITKKIKKECIKLKDIELLKEDYINPSLTMTCSSPKENLEQNKTFVGVNKKVVAYPSKPIILRKSKQSKRFKHSCVSPVTSNRRKSKEDEHLSIPMVDKINQTSNNLKSVPDSSIMYENIEKEETCNFELHDNERQSSDNVISVPITNNVYETMEEEICLEFNVNERQTGNAITDDSITSNNHQTEEGDISHCELTDNARQTSDAKAGNWISKQNESLEEEKICFSDLNDNEREAKIEKCIEILLKVDKKPQMRMVWLDRCREILRLLIKLAGSEEAGAKLLAERILPLFREGFTQAPTLSNLLEIAGIKNKAHILESIPQLSVPVAPSIVQEPASNNFETRLPHLFIEIPFSRMTPAEIVHEVDDDETLMQPVITNALKSLDKVLEEESHRKECVPVDSILDNSMFSSVIEVRIPPVDNLLCLSPEAKDINIAKQDNKNKNDVPNGQQLKMRSILTASARKELQKLKKLRKTNPEIARYIKVRRVSLEPSQEEEQNSTKIHTPPSVVSDDPSVQDAGPDVTLKPSQQKRRKSKVILEPSQGKEWKSRKDSTPRSLVSDDHSLLDVALQPSEQKRRKSSVILESSQEECRKSRAAFIPPSDVLNDPSVPDAVPGITPELSQQKRRISGGVIEPSQEKEGNSTEASAPPSVVSDDPLVQDPDPDVTLQPSQRKRRKSSVILEPSQEEGRKSREGCSTRPSDSISDDPSVPDTITDVTLKISRQKKKSIAVKQPIVLLDKLSVAQVTHMTKRRKSSHRVVTDKPLLSEAPKERNIQIKTMLDKFAKFKEKLDTPEIHAPEQQKQVKSLDTSVKSTAKKRQKSTIESISIFKRTRKVL